LHHLFFSSASNDNKAMMMMMMMILILIIKLRRKKEKGSDKRGEHKLSLSLSFSPWLFCAFVFARTLRAFREKCREKLIFEKFFVCCLGFEECEQEVHLNYDYIYYVHIIDHHHREKKKKKNHP